MSNFSDRETWHLLKRCYSSILERKWRVCISNNFVKRCCFSFTHLFTHVFIWYICLSFLIMIEFRYLQLETVYRTMTISVFARTFHWFTNSRFLLFAWIKSTLNFRSVTWIIPELTNRSSPSTRLSAITFRRHLQCHSARMRVCFLVLRESWFQGFHLNHTRQRPTRDFRQSPQTRCFSETLVDCGS